MISPADPEPGDSADSWTQEQIEDAYQQALSAMEAAEAELGQALETLWEENPEAEEELPLGQNIGALSGDESGTGPLPQDEPTALTSRGVQLTSTEIIEALLFVGGQALTAKRIASVLGGSYTGRHVEEAIEALNLRYDQERRPYFIELQEGGYKLSLKPEFDGLRDRVFGLGPKEVKLTQDALEILSLIAYRQPISRAQIEEQREGNAGNILRQLVRRELITLDRNSEDPDNTRYSTTARFLEVFGLTNLKELPRASDIDWK